MKNAIFNKQQQQKKQPKCQISKFRLRPRYFKHFMLCLFVCFVALRSKSTAMVIAGRSVHLTTLFPGQAQTSG